MNLRCRGWLILAGSQTAYNLRDQLGRYTFHGIQVLNQGGNSALVEMIACCQNLDQALEDITRDSALVCTRSDCLRQLADICKSLLGRYKGNFRTVNVGTSAVRSLGKHTCLKDL